MKFRRFLKLKALIGLLIIAKQSFAIRAFQGFKALKCYFTAKSPDKRKQLSSVFKSSFQKDGASASDDIAVFIDYGTAVVVVVVIVKGVENIFYTHCYHS